MPVDVTALLVGTLVTYLSKGAEEVVKSAGKDVYEHAKKFLVMLKDRWRSEPDASLALQNFEGNPTLYRPVMESLIASTLAEDIEMRSAAEALVQSLGIHVIQDFATDSTNVVGIEAEDIRSGRIVVEQTGVKGSGITGVRAKRIG